MAEHYLVNGFLVFPVGSLSGGRGRSRRPSSWRASEGYGQNSRTFEGETLAAVTSLCMAEGEPGYYLTDPTGETEESRKDPSYTVRRLSRASAEKIRSLGLPQRRKRSGPTLAEAVRLQRENPKTMIRLGDIE